MPVMTGWEFIEAYQELNLPISPFIIVLTSSQHSDDIERGNSIDMVHKLIGKPLDTTHLETIRQDLLQASLMSNEE